MKRLREWIACTLCPRGRREAAKLYLKNVFAPALDLAIQRSRAFGYNRWVREIQVLDEAIRGYRAIVGPLEPQELKEERLRIQRELEEAFGMQIEIDLRYGAGFKAGDDRQQVLVDDGPEGMLATRYLKLVFEPALYEAAKLARHTDAYRSFPKVFGALNCALAGYWALVGSNESYWLQTLRLKLQKKVAEKHHIAILGDGKSGYGFLFAELDRFEYGRDYRVNPENKRFEWLNPKAYGGAPESEEGSDE